MLCIHNPHTDAWFNLAAEEYLLKNFSEDIFMLWQNEPAVVIGKYQNIWAEADLEYAGQKQIKLARRYSGGGAVYHDMGNLNLSFIENSSQIRPTGFTNSIIDFLETYGLHACSDERQGLTIDGLKISGSAQAIHKRRMLHHATLLFSTDLETLEHVLRPSIEYTTGHDTAARPYFVPSVKSPVTNLCGKLPVPITIDKFKQSLLAYFSARSTAFRPYKFTDQDLEEIRLLRNKKYADENWIFNTYTL